MADTGASVNEKGVSVTLECRREHPLFRKISYTNGAINAMSDEKKREELERLSLSSSGSSDVILKRLKTYHRANLIRADLTAPKELASQVETNPLGLEYLCVIDFEATCEELNPPDYIHEIIEFPAVLLNVQTLKISVEQSHILKLLCGEAEFHSYCRPLLCRNLSKFCTSLTGITQSMVNTAPIFTEVFANFNKWLEERKLGTVHNFAVVTDCPWDIRDCLFPQCALANIPFPKYTIKWIDMRKMFGSFYQTETGNLATILDHLGMRFEGREHCGRDDARNIARVMVQMITDGCILRYNRALSQHAVAQYGTPCRHDRRT